MSSAPGCYGKTSDIQGFTQNTPVGKSVRAISRCPPLKEYSSRPHLDAYGDEDDAAEDLGFARKAAADLSAEREAGDADGERNDADDQGGDECGERCIFGDGKAHGQSVNGCRDALEDERAESERCTGRRTGSHACYRTGFCNLRGILRGICQGICRIYSRGSFFPAGGDPFQEHFAADIQQEDQGDPRNEHLEGCEDPFEAPYENPPRERHHKLKCCEGPGNQQHFSFPHILLGESVSDGNGERVHREPDAEQRACNEEF